MLVALHAVPMATLFAPSLTLVAMLALRVDHQIMIRSIIAFPPGPKAKQTAVISPFKKPRRYMIIYFGIFIVLIKLCGKV
jgi:hypothetical protein